MRDIGQQCGKCGTRPEMSENAGFPHLLQDVGNSDIYVTYPQINAMVNKAQGKGYENENFHNQRTPQHRNTLKPRYFM